MGKMTKAQAELLAIIARRPIETSRSYRPSAALIKLGYAEWRKPINHIARNRWLEVTPAGILALEEHNGK